MYEMIQTLLANLAILFIMYIGFSLLLRKVHHWDKKRIRIIQIALVVTASLAMIQFPILFKDFRFDLRLIPLIFLALTTDWRWSIPALTVVSIGRFVAGGSGAVIGVVFGIIIPILVLLVLYPKRRSLADFSFRQFLLLSSLAFLISDLAVIFFIPNGLTAFMELTPYWYPAFLLGSAILYIMLIDTIHRNEMSAQLKYYADHDPLTGLYNPRRFYDQIKEVKYKSPAYIAMADLDHFKRLNDQYGHLTGDKVLTDVANIFLSYINDHNFVGRYGGEEFIVYFYETDEVTVKQTLEAIRNAIASTTFYSHEGEAIRITISIGTTKVHDYQKINTAIDLADKNLYTAKREGRNKLVCGKEMATIC